VASAAQRLEHEIGTLQGRHGRDFFFELKAHLQRLAEDPVLGLLLEDVRADGRRVFQDFEQYDEAGVAECIQLRDSLLTIAPDLDDSDMQEPAFGAPSMQYDFSFARFNDIVAGASPQRGIPVAPTGAEDNSRTGALLGILTNKVHEARWVVGGDDPSQPRGIAPADQRPELRVIAERVQHRGETHRHRHRSLTTEARTHPGVSLMRLDYLVGQMNPEPLPAGTPSEQRAHHRLEAAIRGVVPLFQALLYGTPSDEERQNATRLEEEYRAEIARVHAELGRRAASADRDAVQEVRRLRDALHKLGPLLAGVVAGLVAWIATPSTTASSGTYTALVGALLVSFGWVVITRRLYNIHEYASPTRLTMVSHAILVIVLGGFAIVGAVVGTVAAASPQDASGHVVQLLAAVIAAQVAVAVFDGVFGKDS
jgi:hypothetical protein